jgi:hypothetical protein
LGIRIGNPAPLELDRPGVRLLEARYHA